ncbi:hypothetical protein COLO4_28487 [Corchorus olitorius]|uniref:Uncharacterized protein n=1 Tax=Corchorus olitorius TaxID=93759 RepID=A0A1R3HKM9_9ROSI|nr:hypothetical protein COLO4_28487 [Corchorus olitorius]
MEHGRVEGPPSRRFLAAWYCFASLGFGGCWLTILEIKMEGGKHRSDLWRNIFFYALDFGFLLPTAVGMGHVFIATYLGFYPSVAEKMNKRGIVGYKATTRRFPRWFTLAVSLLFWVLAALWWILLNKDWKEFVKNHKDNQVLRACKSNEDEPQPQPSSTAKVSPVSDIESAQPKS